MSVESNVARAYRRCCPGDRGRALAVIETRAGSILTKDGVCAARETCNACRLSRVATRMSGSVPTAVRTRPSTCRSPCEHTGVRPCGCTAARARRTTAVHAYRHSYIRLDFSAPVRTYLRTGVLQYGQAPRARMSRKEKGRRRPRPKGARDAQGAGTIPI